MGENVEKYSRFISNSVACLGCAKRSGYKKIIPKKNLVCANK